MRSISRLAIVGFGLAVIGSASGRGADSKATKAESGCARHGTKVDFLDTPSEAARKALKEEKLVFVLHVSGNFEDPRFT
jgi:hypothetical protein